MKEITVLLQFSPFKCYSESRLTCCSAPIMLRILVISMEGWHSTYQPFLGALLLHLIYLASPQGLPGKDGETGAAGPPGPAVRITDSSPLPILLHL